MSTSPAHAHAHESTRWEGRDFSSASARDRDPGGLEIVGVLTDTDQEAGLREVGWFNARGIAARVAEGLNRGSGRDGVIPPVGPDDITEAQRVIGGLLYLGFQPVLVERARAWLTKAEAGQLGEPLYGLALSLVQDLGALIDDSDGVTGLHLNNDVAMWDELTGGDWLSSFARLRDHLDGAEARPQLTLVVNGVEFRTHDRHVKGKLGGCVVEAVWDGMTSMKITVGPHDPGPPPVILFGAPEEEDEGCPKGDPDCYGPADGCHDACEAPPADFTRSPPVEGLECMKGTEHVGGRAGVDMGGRDR